MKKTIYVPSQKVWDEITKKANEAGITVSKFLLKLTPPADTQLDRIEAKLDELLGKKQQFLFKGGFDRVDAISKNSIKEPVVSTTTLEKGNIDLKDKLKRLVAEKKAGVAYFNPQPKTEKKRKVTK